MKIVLESHRDYLFVVRLIKASIHEPRKINEILDTIDDSGINRELKMGEITSLFTLKEIKELQSKSGEILNLSEKKNLKKLSSFILRYVILSGGILDLKKMGGRAYQPYLEKSAAQ